MNNKKIVPFIILFVAFIVAISAAFSNKIHNEGLRSIFNEIWYGSNHPTSYPTNDCNKKEAQ